jgi:hypothetical protein
VVRRFSKPAAFPSILHDAVTISSSQVPNLSTQYPSVSDSIVMIVGTGWNADGTVAATEEVVYYDPGNNQWMPETPISLPWPNAPGCTTLPSACNAVAYFGAINGQISQSGGWCSPYTWSPSVPATLQVMASLSGNTCANSLGSWYLDPTSGGWQINQSCATDYYIWWSAEICMATSFQCPIAAAPVYTTPQSSSSCTSDLCTTLQWTTDPLDPVVTTTLNLNDQYLLTSRVKHNTAYHWEADLAALEDEYWIESISVDLDYAGKGKVSLRGAIPDPLVNFGDFSVVMNRSKKDLRLTKTKNFSEKLATRGILSYSSPRAKMTANLKTGWWTCEVDSALFKTPRPVSDKNGTTDLRLKVGGREVYKKLITTDYYKMDLKYGE